MEVEFGLSRGWGGLREGFNQKKNKRLYRPGLIFFLLKNKNLLT